MFYLILIAAIAVYTWFFYTNRRDTVHTTGVVVGATASSIRSTVRAIKLEADIAKVSNDIASIDQPIYEFSGRKQGIKHATTFMAELGIDSKYFDSRKSKLADLRSELTSKGGN